VGLLLVVEFRKYGIRFEIQDRRIGWQVLQERSTEVLIKSANRMILFAVIVQ
jgi:hypothetical protein